MLKMMTKPSHQAMCSRHPGYRSKFPATLSWYFCNHLLELRRRTAFLFSHRIEQKLLREKKPRDSFLLVSRKKGFHQCLHLCLSDCCNHCTLCGQPECQFHLNETEEAQLLSLQRLCLSSLCQFPFLC